MNTLEMWMDYADGLSGDCRVLLFGYPQELRTNQTLVTGMHAFFQTLGIEKPHLCRRKRRRDGCADLCAEVSGRNRRSDSDLHRRHGRKHAEKPEKKILLCAAHVVVHEALQLRKAQADAYQGGHEPYPRRRSPCRSISKRIFMSRYFIRAARQRPTHRRTRTSRRRDRNRSRKALPARRIRRLPPSVRKKSCFP